MDIPGPIHRKNRPGATIPEEIMQANVILFGLALISALFVSAGALLAVNPTPFVSVYRRIAIGDYYARSKEWELKVGTLEGRLGGCVLLCGGLGGVYFLLPALRIF